MGAPSLNTLLLWGLIAVLLVLMLRYGCGMRMLKRTTEPAQEVDDKLTKDPVCGVELDPEHAAGQASYRDRTYHFCSAACREQFEKDPVRFAYEPPRKRGCC